MKSIEGLRVQVKRLSDTVDFEGYDGQAAVDLSGCGIDLQEALTELEVAREVIKAIRPHYSYLEGLQMESVRGATLFDDLFNEEDAAELRKAAAAEESKLPIFDPEELDI